MNLLITQNSQNLEHSHTAGNQTSNPNFSWSGSHSHRQKMTNQGTDYIEVRWDTYPSGSINGPMPSSTMGKGLAQYTEGTNLNISGTTTGNHTHTINASGGTETRTVNYSYKVWKRVS